MQTMQKDKLIQLVEQPDKFRQEDLPELQALVNDYPYCQTFQMLYAKALYLFDNENYNKELAKIALSVNRTQLFYFIHQNYAEKTEKNQLLAAEFDYLAYLENLEPIEAEQKQPNKNDILIDSFIEKNPKIQPSKLDENLSQIIDNELIERGIEDECFSETLAKIYIKQKKYEKAIKIFEKLNLKYPEKSIYFADQIRFLTIIVNYNKK